MSEIKPIDVGEMKLCSRHCPHVYPSHKMHLAVQWPNDPYVAYFCRKSSSLVRCHGKYVDGSVCVPALLREKDELIAENARLSVLEGSISKATRYALGNVQIADTGDYETGLVASETGDWIFVGDYAQIVKERDELRRANEQVKLITKEETFICSTCNEHYEIACCTEVHCDYCMSKRDEDIAKLKATLECIETKNEALFLQKKELQRELRVRDDERKKLEGDIETRDRVAKEYRDDIAKLKAEVERLRKHRKCDLFCCDVFRVDDIGLCPSCDRTMQHLFEKYVNPAKTKATLLQQAIFWVRQQNVKIEGNFVDEEHYCEAILERFKKRNFEAEEWWDEQDNYYFGYPLEGIAVIRRRPWKDLGTHLDEVTAINVAYKDSGSLKKQSGSRSE